MEKYNQKTGVHDVMANKPKMSVYMKQQLDDVKKMEDNLFYSLNRYRMAVFVGKPNEAAKWSKIVEELKYQYARFEAKP